MCSATFASTSAGPAPTTVPAGPTTVPAVPTTVAVPTPPTTAGLPAPPTTVAAVPASIPPATQQPTGLGTDTTLDAMAQSCFAGDMSACDNLFFAAPANSAYEAYGDTCAGRQPPFSGLCVDAFGPPATVPATTAPAVTSTTAPVVTAVPPTTAPAVTVTPTSLVPATTIVPGVVPPPTLQPTGLGDDAALNALAQACYDGDLASCDDLWRQSELGAPYKDFGDTCAGRQPPNTSVWCVDAFGAATGPSTTAVVAVPPTVSTVVPTVVSGIPPAAQPPTGLGADAALDVLAQGCFAGDMGACDRLFKLAPIGSAYETYGDTCAGRQPEGTFTYCRAAFPG